MAERGSIKVTVVGATDVGRVRDHNEDNLLVADLTAAERAEDGQTIQRELGERGLLMAVADGMGGAASGEIASQTAVDTVYESFSKKGFLQGAAEPEQVRDGLIESLNTANKTIYERGQEEAEHRGMGTTMTAAFVLGDTVHFAQVGDSRAYLLRKGKLNQVTKDQSLISQLIEEGTLTEEEAEKLGGRNIILQALGVEPSVNVETKSLEILDGDLLALCSDGLSGMVKDDLLQSTLAGADDLGATSRRLVELANEAGGRDNITVILVRFEGAGLRQPLRPLETEERPGRGDRPQVTGFAPAEPPPEEPAKGKFRLVFFAGMAVLVLAAVAVLLSGGTGNLTLVFPEGATGVRAELKPQSGDGAAIVGEAGPGEFQVRFPDLPSGQYLLHATRAGFTDVVGLPIEVRGDLTLPVKDLRPLPGSLVLVIGTPRATVRIREKVPGKPPFEFSAEDVGPGELQVSSVPAGDLLIDVRRADFTAIEAHPVTLAPGQEGCRVELLPLEPMNGTLVIEYRPGAVITVTDENNDPIGESVVVPPAGKVSIPVRQGAKRRVRAEHASLEPAVREFDIRMGRELSLTLEQVDLRGSIEVTGPPGARLVIRLIGAVELRRRAKLPDTTADGVGHHRESNLPPGDYEVDMTDGERSETQAVKLLPGGRETVRFAP